MFLRPRLTKFVKDKGVDKPPMEYMLAIEQGLRRYSLDKFAFGTFANHTYEEYTAVDIWRKREAYIGVVRYVLGKGNYAKYVNFKWEDYIMRSHLTKTFQVRHAPYTDGTNDELRKLLPDPKHWNENKGKDFRSRKKKKKQQKFKEEDEHSPSPLNPSDKCVWDSEDELWVPIEE